MLRASHRFMNYHITLFECCSYGSIAAQRSHMGRVSYHVAARVDRQAHSQGKHWCYQVSAIKRRGRIAELKRRQVRRQLVTGITKSCLGAVILERELASQLRNKGWTITSSSTTGLWASHWFRCRLCGSRRHPEVGCRLFLPDCWTPK